MGTELPLGEFTCAITFESVRPPSSRKKMV
jgi:hypothetical protein